MCVVSVIIPNYNHEKYLHKRIESVLDQTYQDFEIIILDDHSTDNSKTIIEQYRDHPKVSHILYNELNGGSAFKQWEKGIALAKGKYIWIAESDDYCETNFLEIAIDELTNNNSSLFFCGSFDVDEESTVIGDYSWFTNDITSIKWNDKFTMPATKFIFKALRYKNVIINASGVVFEATDFTFSKIRNYKTCGDWLFWIAVLNSPAKKISFVSENLNYFRRHANTTRNANTPEKNLRSTIEEITVKHDLCKLGYLSREEFYEYIVLKMHSLKPSFKILYRICKELYYPSFLLIHSVFIRLSWKIAKNKLLNRLAIKHFLKTV